MAAEPILRRLHVLGRRELSLLVGGEANLPAPEVLAPRPWEHEEAAIPEGYGSVEDGCVMRTLQDFCFYHEDGTPAPIEALDDKNKTKVIGFGTVLPRDYKPKPKEKRKPGGAGGLPPSASTASLASAGTATATVGGPAPAPAPGMVKMKLKLPSRPGAGSGQEAAAGGGAAAVGVKRLRLVGAGSGGGGGGEEEHERKRLATTKSEGGAGGGEEEGANSGRAGEEDWDAVGLRVFLPEVTEWCIDYSVDGHALLWVVSSSGAWYRVAGTHQLGFVKPHPLYAKMNQSASRKFRACAATARQLLAIYPTNPQADYGTVLSAIEAASGGRVAEAALLEMADFVAAQMAGLKGPLPLVPGAPVAEVKYDHCSFVEGLKQRARQQGIRPITKREREKLSREIGRAQKEMVKTWIAQNAGGGRTPTAAAPPRHQQQQAGYADEQQAAYGGFAPDMDVPPPPSLPPPPPEPQHHQPPVLELQMPPQLPDEVDFFARDDEEEEAPATAGTANGGDGSASAASGSFTPLPPSWAGQEGGGGAMGGLDQSMGSFPGGEENGDGGQDGVGSRASNTIRLKRGGAVGGSSGGRERAVAKEKPPRPSEEVAEVVDDLVELGPEAAASPRPQPRRASELLPADLFPSVLMVWNTLQLCGPSSLRLSPLPLGWLEQAVAAPSVHGLVPDLMQEVIHRLLAAVLKDRKDPGRPVSVAVLDEEYEREEEVGGGSKDAQGGKYRSVETVESVIYRGARADFLLPYGWPELTRLLIAERFHIPLETYLDPLAELQRLLEDLAAQNKAALPFFHKVDPQRDAMPNYFELVEEPMDLGTVLKRLRSGYYEEAAVGRAPTVRRVRGSNKPRPQPAVPTARGKEEEAAAAAEAADAGSVATAETAGGAGEDGEERSAAGGEEEEEEGDGAAGLSRTKGKGPWGVVEDIRLVWSNCERYHGPDAPLTELAQQLSEELEDKIQTRVVEPLERRERALGRPSPFKAAGAAGVKEEDEEEGVAGKKEQGAPLARTESKQTTAAERTVSSEDAAQWREVVDQLGRLTYAELPLRTRVLVLRWLAEEAVATAAVRELLEGIGPGKETYRRLAGRRQAYAAYQQQQLQQQPHPAYREAVPPEVAWTGQDEREFQRLAELAEKDVRLRPLGLDRHHRRYWLFPGDGTYAVYTEEEADGPVTHVYRGREAILKLCGWLSDRTAREGPLRAALLEAVEKHLSAAYPPGYAGAVGPDGFPLVEPAAQPPPPEAFLGYSNGHGAAEREAAGDLLKYLCYPLGITARERGCLGLVYADQELKLTAYRDYQGNLVKQAPFPRMGMVPGDRIVMVNGQVIDGPKWPPGGVEDPAMLQYTPQGEAEEFQLVILRESAKAQQLQIAQLPPRVVASEWGYVQGWLLHTEREVSHPLALGAEWDGPGGRKLGWREQVLRGGKDGAGLKEAALELEARLREKGMVLAHEDREGRALGASGKWRQFMAQSRTPSQMLLGLRLLAGLMDRRTLERALRPLERAEWLSLLPPDRRIDLPDIGAFVIYYPEGHREAVKHNGRFKGPMWNVEGPHDGEGSLPGVQVCQVQGLEYYCFQSNAKDALTLSAWARVKLARLNEPAHAYFWPDRPLRLYRPLEPRGMLARLLGRAVTSGLEMREADQFMEPVSRRDYPDYYELVKTPMDLATLLSRVRRYHYRDHREFLRDLALISKNCHMYCAARFPTLPPMADKVVAAAKTTFDRIRPRVLKAEQEAACLAQRARFWEALPFVDEAKPLEEVLFCEQPQPAQPKPKAAAAASTPTPTPAPAPAASAPSAVAAPAPTAPAAAPPGTAAAPASAATTPPAAPAKNGGEGAAPNPPAPRAESKPVGGAAPLPSNPPPSASAPASAPSSSAGPAPAAAAPPPPVQASSTHAPAPHPPAPHPPGQQQPQQPPVAAPPPAALAPAPSSSLPPPASAAPPSAPHAPTPVPAPAPAPSSLPQPQATAAQQQQQQQQAAAYAAYYYQQQQAQQQGAAAVGVAPVAAPAPAASAAASSAYPYGQYYQGAYGTAAQQQQAAAAAAAGTAYYGQQGYYGQHYAQHPYYQNQAAAAAAAPASARGATTAAQQQQQQAAAQQQQAQQAQAQAPQQPKVVETFYVGVWLSNAVPEFVVSRARYEGCLRRAWRKEERVAARWAAEDARDEGAVYEGTVVGCRAPDKLTGLMPWAPLQIEWEGGDGTEPLGFMNPWAVTPLPQGGGRVDPQGRIEYAPFREVYKHHHSLLDRPRGAQSQAQQQAAAAAAAHAATVSSYQQQVHHAYAR